MENEENGISISHGFPNHETFPASPPIKAMGAQFQANHPLTEMVVNPTVREEPMPDTSKYPGTGDVEEGGDDRERRIQLLTQSLERAKMVKPSAWEETMSEMRKYPGTGDGFSMGTVEEGAGAGGRERRVREPLSIIRRMKGDLMIFWEMERERKVKGTAFLLRVLELGLCWGSLLVMMADDWNHGRVLHSSPRFKEFRNWYKIKMVTLIGLVYSVVQVCCFRGCGEYVFSPPHRFFSFCADQYMTYLLIWASSSAAFRVDFSGLASVSVMLSFMAFVAFAISYLVSIYTLCSSKSRHSNPLKDHK
ncbi:CASP-like protein 4A3 [Cornus florida]|uniref:CASP-like protein 4A3 n=1 Tax=Cornus florida TaxID=4283 RepID=UPI00289ED051|nr:CASP-like protein 4A3 [Cornus florida]